LTDERARLRADLDKNWPKLPALEPGNFKAFSPYTFLHRSMVQWFPTERQQADARANLPYMRAGRYAHLKADNRHDVYFLYVRRPNYYVAFNAGKQLNAGQRYGLGLLWSQGFGTLAQSQSASNINLWGTQKSGSDAPYEAGNLDAKIEVAGKEIKPQPGSTDLGDGDVTVSYPLGESGSKTIRFDNDRIIVKVEHQGDFFEFIPLATREGDSLRIEENRILLQRQGKMALTVEIDQPGKPELLKDSVKAGPYRIVTARIESKGKLSYNVKIAPAPPAIHASAGTVTAR
jgi:hypothetical protein